jgi:hypothetical protein
LFKANPKIGRVIALNRMNWVKHGMVAAICLDCEVAAEVHRKSRLRIDVDESIGVMRIIRGHVIKGYPASFAVGHVDAVAEARCFGLCVVRNHSGVANLSRKVKLWGNPSYGMALLNLTVGFLL